MADERIKKRRLELLSKVVRARLYYLFFGVLTLSNIALALIGVEFELPVYLCIPYFSFLTGFDCLGNGELFGTMMLWFGVMALFAVIYVWLFIRSRKDNRIGGLLALLLVDTAGNLGLILIALVFSAPGASIFTLTLNLAFHLFVVAFTEGGRRAAYGLTLLPTGEEEE